VFSLGVEKVILQSVTFRNLRVLNEIANFGGTQSVSVSIDIIRDTKGIPKVFDSCRGMALDLNISEYLRLLEDHGAGEIILTSVDNEGTYEGFDLELIGLFKESLNVPLVANGGAGSIADFRKAIDSGADAVAAGSLFVFYSPKRGVLLSYPDSVDLSGRPK
jgi:cyclase